MRISDWSSDVCSSDLFTIEAAKKMVTTHDPELMFVDLGDVDRVGHADLTGTTLQLARRAALVNTDVQVKSFIDLLKQTGRWQNTMVIVLADHSMDWSLPHNVIALTDKLGADPERSEKPTSELHALMRHSYAV